MARFFDDASVQYLLSTLTPLTGFEISMACWFKTDDLTLEQDLMSIADSATNNEEFALVFDGESGSGEPIVTLARAGGVSTSASTSTSASVDTWHHACGTWESATSRWAYLDAGGADESTTSNTPTSIDRMAIGARARSSDSKHMSGAIAEAAMWNTTLTPTEVTMLALGLAPYLVRPANLVFYMPMVRDNDVDIIGGISFTPQASPTISDHPRIFHKYSPQLGPAPAAAAVDRYIELMQVRQPVPAGIFDI